MSKLYNIYIDKKKNNESILYLFKSGSFYIFLGQDAMDMSEGLGLKLTKFSSESNKCGFPSSEIERYLKFIKLLNREYEIVLSPEELIINDIRNQSNLTEKIALKKLCEYKEILKNG